MIITKRNTLKGNSKQIMPPRRVNNKKLIEKLEDGCLSINNTNINQTYNRMIKKVQDIILQVTEQRRHRKRTHKKWTSDEFLAYAKHAVTVLIIKRSWKNTNGLETD